MARTYDKPTMRLADNGFIIRCGYKETTNSADKYADCKWGEEELVYELDNQKEAMDKFVEFGKMSGTNIPAQAEKTADEHMG